MKTILTTVLTSGFFIFSLGLSSCGEAAQEKMGATAANVNLEVKRNIEAEAAKPDDNLAGVARNWTKANTYINLKLDATFEAALDANTVMAGKWQLSDDEKTLTLQAEKSAEGKGVAETVVFAVQEISEVGLKLKNAKGEILEFAAQ
jgi:hypothetical protein